MPGPMHRQQILRIAAQLPPHLADPFFHNALRRAAPSGVEDAYGLALAVGHNHRQTVGDLDPQQHSRRVRDQPIAGGFHHFVLAQPRPLRPALLRTPGGSPPSAPGSAEPAATAAPVRILRFQFAQKARLVPLHILRRVFRGESEIQLPARRIPCSLRPAAC